jgi:hypothetical protein
MESKGPAAWSVWRQDDQGNQFCVGSFATEAEAKKLSGELAARGHKQTYWVARAPAGPDGAAPDADGGE